MGPVAVAEAAVGDVAVGPVAVAEAAVGAVAVGPDEEPQEVAAAPIAATSSVAVAGPVAEAVGPFVEAGAAAVLVVE